MIDTCLFEFVLYSPPSVNLSAMGWQPKEFSLRRLLFFLQNIDFKDFPKEIVPPEKPTCWPDTSELSSHNNIGFAIVFKILFWTLMRSRIRLSIVRVHPGIGNLGINQDERKI
jgi:hypothetical protein